MNEKQHRAARVFGAIAQGLILGTLIFVALLQLVETSSAGQVFRYQGF